MIEIILFSIMSAALIYAYYCLYIFGKNFKEVEAILKNHKSGLVIIHKYLRTLIETVEKKAAKTKKQSGKEKDK